MLLGQDPAPEGSSSRPSGSGSTRAGSTGSTRGSTSTPTRVWSSSTCGRGSGRSRATTATATRPTTRRPACADARRPHGVAVVALYHTRKAESTDFVETVQGTFGTAGAADTIVVIKRSRGEADATLHVTGRDVVEQELALRFAARAGAWELLGDADEYGLGQTRKEILELVDAHGALTPKQVSDLTTIAHETAKKTMQRMFQDGQLAARNGRYSIPPKPPVPDVPCPPMGGQRDAGDRGLEGATTRPAKTRQEEHGHDRAEQCSDLREWHTIGTVAPATGCSSIVPPYYARRSGNGGTERSSSRATGRAAPALREFEEIKLEQITNSVMNPDGYRDSEQAFAFPTENGLWDVDARMCDQYGRRAQGVCEIRIRLHHFDEEDEEPRADAARVQVRDAAQFALEDYCDIGRFKGRRLDDLLFHEYDPARDGDFAGIRHRTDVRRLAAGRATGRSSRSRRTGTSSGRC